MISETYEQLVIDLVAGYAVTGVGYVPRVAVHTVWPDRVSLPAVLVVPPPPDGLWLEPGQFLGCLRVNVRVVCLVAKDVDQLWKLVDTAVRNTADWSLQGVDSPGTTSVSGMDMLGCILHLSKQTKID